MTAETRTDAQALAHAIDRVRERGERLAGGDSWGVAWVRPEGGLEVRHGLGRMPDHEARHLRTKATTTALAHTRLATAGGVTKANAHPFPIHDPATGDRVAALAHNGTWYDAPRERDDPHSDTYYIARRVEEALSEQDGRPDVAAALEAAAPDVGETLLVLDRRGRIHTYAGRFSIEQQETDVGARVASDGLGGNTLADGTMMTHRDPTELRARNGYRHG